MISHRPPCRVRFRAVLTCDRHDPHVELYPTLLDIAVRRRRQINRTHGERHAPLLRDGSAKLKRGLLPAFPPLSHLRGAGPWRNYALSRRLISGDWQMMDFFEDIISNCTHFTMTSAKSKAPWLAKQSPRRPRNCTRRCSPGARR